MSWRTIISTLREFADQRLFDVGGTAVTVASLVTFVLIMLVTWWISSIARRVAARTLVRGGITETGTVATIKRLLHYVVLLVGLGIALQTVGINLASLFAAGAVVAVAVGFAMQNILQNFASGVILLAERSITEGDVLEVDGMLIRVESIGTRATVARTRDDEQLIIPNSLLVQSSVKNFTLTDSLYRIRCRVGVSYGSDMARVEQVLYDAALTVKLRSKHRKPALLLLEFGDSSVVWEASIWGEDPWEGRIIQSELNKAIWNGLKAAGIVIAFPQLDLHFDPRSAPGRASED